jgi:hypothetical protein
MTTSLTIRQRRRSRCFPHSALTLISTTIGGLVAVRHDTVVSRRRRSHATAASSDFFCVPFGGRANRRVSTPPTRPLRRRSPRCVRRMHLRLRVRGLRPTCGPAAAPDGDLHQGLHDRNALVRLGRRLRRRRPWRPGARHRLRRMRPALPASSAPCAPRRRGRRKGFRRLCNWASDADGDDGGPGSRIGCDMCVYMGPVYIFIYMPVESL